MGLFRNWSRWTDWQKREAIRMYYDGAEVSDIALRFNRTKHCMIVTLRNWKVKRRREQPKVPHSVEVSIGMAIAHMKHTGKSLRQIARDHKVNPSVVARIRDELLE